MKEQLTLKNIIIVLCCFYSVTVVERLFSRQYRQDELIKLHNEEKMNLEKRNLQLNYKVKEYEIKILETNAGVDTLSNDELDSVWSTIFN